MKHIAAILTFSLFFSLTCLAQKGSKMGLYALFGYRHMNINQTFISGAENIPNSSILGAGSYWMKKHFVLETEFQISEATTCNKQFESSYSGFRSAMLAGYNFSTANNWNITPLLGAGISKNKVSFSNKLNISTVQNANSSIYVNDIPVINVALSIQKSNSKGSLFGIKVGYEVPFNNKSSWTFSGSDLKTNPGNLNGFYIQIITGGLFNL